MRTLVLLSLLALTPLAPGRAADAVTKAEGPHFRVVLHFEGEGLEKSALAQVEALWNEAAALYGLSDGARRKKLEVHLYRTRADYDAADERLTGGAFQRNQAFAHYDSMTAHVALQPPISDSVLAVVGLPSLTRSMLLHEAAHLVRFTAMSNYRSHPDWLEDGAAMFLKLRVAAGDRTEAEPLSSTNVVQVQSLRTKGSLPAPGAILDDALDDLSFYDRYAVRWLFFRFLSEKHRFALRETVKGTRRLGGGTGLGAKVKKLLAERMGASGFRRLGETWPKYVASLAPEWSETYRSLSGGAARRVQIAFPGTNALAWRTKPMGKDRYRIRGTVTILDNSRHQLNLLLDRTDSGFICIALKATRGVTLFHYRSKEDRWVGLRFAARTSLTVGQPFRVDLAVEGSRLTLLIDDEPVLDEVIEGRDMKGPWGLGAFAGSAGIWEGISVK